MWPSCGQVKTLTCTQDTTSVCKTWLKSGRITKASTSANIVIDVLIVM